MRCAPRFLVKQWGTKLGKASSIRMHRYVERRRGWRLPLMIVIMLAVLASLTLHHGAMASQPAAGHHVQQNHVHSGDACVSPPCGQQHHTLPECCGLGLCLAALPVPAVAETPGRSGGSHQLMPLHVDVRWPIHRLDRPPRNS